MLLNNEWINAINKGEIRKYIKANENGNTTFFFWGIGILLASLVKIMGLYVMGIWTWTLK